MNILAIVEIIGTIAFAMSGALVAIKKDLDYYGIAVLAIVTATGGGIIRDLLISNSIPYSLENPSFALISIASAAFIVFFYNRVKMESYRRVIHYLDAIGLAAFTAIGAKIAIENGFDQTYIVVTFSVLTGTGGGIIRDVFSGEIPFVFRKEIYAVASIVGSLVYLIILKVFDPNIALYSCLLVTLLIRIYSIKKDLHLGCVENRF